MMQHSVPCTVTELISSLGLGYERLSLYDGECERDENIAQLEDVLTRATCPLTRFARQEFSESDNFVRQKSRF